MYCSYHQIVTSTILLLYCSLASFNQSSTGTARTGGTTVSTGTGTDIFTYIFLKKVNGETHQSVMSCFFNFLSHFFSPIFFCKNRYIRVTFFTLQFQLFFKKMHSSICNELLFESFYLKKKKKLRKPNMVL